MGRTIDAIKQGEICAIISVGGSRRTAAKYVGCAAESIGRKACRDPEFAERLARAEADFEVIHLSNIQQAGKKSWNASAWLLERVYPERFAKRGAATIPVRQLDDVLTRLGQVIKEEVSDPERVKRLVTRLQELLTEIAADAVRKSRK
ncbi:MAG TPA: hypothetical protein VGG64_20925 [Pirellulales bacterium]|jgi:hypothetical protein